ncbi:DUF1109 domain-containing protein [Nocardia sp. NPDC050408]|uniref:DUF1109 domain-containing protein n=1 Tax=Nocardia sp. NPDC050408 TaxID=3364319 RepID=UPI003789C904
MVAVVETGFPIETSFAHHGQSDGGQGAATAPGSIVLTGAIVGVAFLLCVHLDWAPFVGNLTGPDQLVVLVIGGVLLGVSLLRWAIKTLYLLGREHRWSWKVAAVPLIVVAGLVAGLILRPASFGSARAEMEGVAVEMLREDGPSTRRDVSPGGLDISLVHRESDGRVYFYEADGFVGSTVRGWVYSPDSEPVGSGGRRFEKLSGDWYSFVFDIE